MDFSAQSLNDVLLYGANGYTGRLTSHFAAQLGAKPILAGRDREALRGLSELTGLPTRVFSLDSPVEIDRQLNGVKLVLHFAGPFSKTSKTMLDACLRTGVHYLDITGEIEVFEAIAARSDEIKKAGVIAIPGVGFDVVPTDCLAARLKAALPDAVKLELAFHGAGAFSRGTLKTMIEKIGEGTWIRREGRLVESSIELTRKVDFGKGVIPVRAISWGDVSTAFRTTGIPNIVVYAALPKIAGKILSMAPRFKFLFSSAPVVKALQNLVEMTVDGPTPNQVQNSTMSIWGRVENANGKSVELRTECLEGYRFTAISSLLAAFSVLSGNIQPGAMTASGAFGSDFFDRVMDLARKHSVPAKF